ncbi:MAG TPA: PstS family phosphate ABC transporter substrate-binding protein [Accumulibacter sp.]|uniref:PstS family phosphate ABC transporter substrate-binding protein n=1 Tax=Accumulibacter sp. TaxID=2053492 RepID=UPI002BB97ED5|nr:PstS family phosphate ABC transporter substrate-binding protein [Accumulibacter sp.]HMW57492.1 PstS family phosphate ABC transporter substrate-binding protein [Accumulibacter sp.]
MKRTVLASAFLALAASSVQAESLVKVDGSSTVYPVTEAVAEDFQKSVKGEIKVTVGISGTGGGFKKFCRGEIDVANASRPILKKEMEDCAKEGITYYELPVAFDALTVVVNPNSKITQLSVAQLKKMWEPDAQGKVSNWNQVDPAFPDAPLNLFGAGSDSGTFDYFTEAINGKSKASRGDYTASEDDNVLVQGVSRDVNAIGYFGYAYYAENQGKLKAVAIVNSKGEAVLPSEKTVIDGSYNPLARPIFIYVSAKALERAEVRQFVDFYMKNAPALTSEVKYVPLPAKAYEANMEHMKSKKLGTVFGGHADVGVTIEELISREAKL